MENNQFELQNKSVQSNDLIRSVWSMDAVSLKIFEMVVSCLDSYPLTKESNNLVHISKSAIYSMFSASDSNRHFRFKNHLKALQKQIVSVVDYESKKITQIVPFPTVQWGIDDSDDLVMFEINKRILPYLLELKRNYTSYEIQNIRGLTSKYAILLYKFVKMNAFKGGSFTVTIEDYRKYSNTIKDYARFADFEKRVLYDAKNEINASYGDILVSYEKVRPSRKITHIRFFWRERMPLEETIDYDPFKNIKI